MTNQLAKYEKPQMLARIEGAKFPTQLTKLEKDMLAHASIDYGLDPLMGELTIYQGKLFVTYDGRVRKAHETEKFEGIESRPATAGEREARGTPPDYKLWRSDVYRTGCTRPFTGWGEVLASEQKGNAFLPLVSRPDRMAEKRSQVAAMRLAFYLPLPSIEDADTEEAPVVKVIADNPNVNTTTGEVIESEVVEATGDFSEEPSTAEKVADGIKASLDKLPPMPAVRDESPVTNDQCIELEKLVTESGSSMQKVGYWIKQTKKWEGIAKMSNLKVWQLNEIKVWLNSGK